MKDFDVWLADEYRNENADRQDCEVAHLLRISPAADKWMKGNGWHSMRHVHHIGGRPRIAVRNYWTNLIYISKSSHDYIHDQNPNGGELCCWLAKIRRQFKTSDWRKTLRQPTVINPMFMHFSLAVADKLVVPFDGFEGRISYLRYKVEGEFKTLADQILETLNDSRLREDQL